MGAVINAFNNMGEGILAFIFKLIFILAAIAFAMVLVVFLIQAWPFTVSFVIGILFCEIFYEKVSETTNIKLPDYFYINVEDFLQTFSQGDEEVERVRSDLEEKREAAEKDVAVMREALKSAEYQLEQVKAKRSLKNLFKRQPADISDRAAKALEMELGKPKWTQYIDEASQETSAWERLLA